MTTVHSSLRARSATTRDSLAAAPRAAVRCAIYTRKSSDDGLEQAFNSLDAQRESGETYIASHRGEGWTCVPEHFNDGGFSGGSMERPALKQLLAEVQAGRVDAIVVYKLDRLTRSIRDFAKIMEVLDAHKVSLVVVTQPINTGTSMGRLMVHVLMSFAQFERELASERTRDKIALSRQRGQWTGGSPVLGYDFAGCKLTVNPREATLVRTIFGLYLEHRSLRVVLRVLAERGITNKAWTTRDGRAMGGKPIVTSGLARLLSNILYIGKVPHGQKSYSGQHEAIVEPVVFERVGRLLTENARCGASFVRNRYGGLLKGLIRCAACGRPMVHQVTTKQRGGAYRYYGCTSSLGYQGKQCPSKVIPAEQVELFVIDKVRPLLATPALATTILDASRAETEECLRDLEARRDLLATELRANEARAAKGDIDAAIGSMDLSQQLSKLDQEIAATNTSLPNRATIQQALDDFDSLWCQLSPNERARALSLAIREVVYDAQAGEIRIVPNNGATSADFKAEQQP